jgi:hypothetical protein
VQQRRRNVTLRADHDPLPPALDPPRRAVSSFGVHFTACFEPATRFCLLRVCTCVLCSAHMLHCACHMSCSLGIRKSQGSCFVLGANVNLHALFRRNTESCYSPHIADQVSHPFKGRIFTNLRCVPVFIRCGRTVCCCRCYVLQLATLCLGTVIHCVLLSRQDSLLLSLLHVATGHTVSCCQDRTVCTICPQFSIPTCLSQCLALFALF